MNTCSNEEVETGTGADREERTPMKKQWDELSTLAEASKPSKHATPKPKASVSPEGLGFLLFYWLISGCESAQPSAKRSAVWGRGRK